MQHPKLLTEYVENTILHFTSSLLFPCCFFTSLATARYWREKKPEHPTKQKDLQQTNG